MIPTAPPRKKFLATPLTMACESEDFRECFLLVLCTSDCQVWGQIAVLEDGASFKSMSLIIHEHFNHVWQLKEISELALFLRHVIRQEPLGHSGPVHSGLAQKGAVGSVHMEGGCRIKSGPRP